MRKEGASGTWGYLQDIKGNGEKSQRGEGEAVEGLGERKAHYRFNQKGEVFREQSKEA